MQPPLSCGVAVDPPEALNNALHRGRAWTVEVPQNSNKPLLSLLHAIL